MFCEVKSLCNSTERQFSTLQTQNNDFTWQDLIRPTIRWWRAFSLSVRVCNWTLWVSTVGPDIWQQHFSLWHTRCNVFTSTVTAELSDWSCCISTGDRTERKRNWFRTTQGIFNGLMKHHVRIVGQEKGRENECTWESKNVICSISELGATLPDNMSCT